MVIGFGRTKDWDNSKIWTKCLSWVWTVKVSSVLKKTWGEKISLQIRQITIQIPKAKTGPCFRTEHLWSYDRRMAPYTFVNQRMYFKWQFASHRENLIKHRSSITKKNTEENWISFPAIHVQNGHNNAGVLSWLVRPNCETREGYLQELRNVPTRCADLDSYRPISLSESL